MILPLLNKAQGHENKEVVFWAYWSALMLGDPHCAWNTPFMQKWLAMLLAR